MEWLTRYYDEDIVLRRAIDIACPDTVNRRTALFYVHGGGWHAGARDLFHLHLQHFARQGYVCASAGYRLAPEVRLSGQMGDLIDGYASFVEYVRGRWATIDRFVVLGSSAGAHLAALLALTSPTEWTRGSGPGMWRKPAACVSINGPGTLERWEPMNADIKKSIESALGVAYGEDDARFRQASPLARVDRHAADFLFLIAGKEPYFPHSFVYGMSEKLKRFGKRSDVTLFPEAEHGFFYDVASPLQREALAVLEAFLAVYE